MKAKTHSAVLAALVAVAVLVSAESAVAMRQLERAGIASSLSARACAARDLTLAVVKCATHAVVSWAKS